MIDDEVTMRGRTQMTSEGGREESNGKGYRDPVTYSGVVTVTADSSVTELLVTRGNERDEER